MAMGGIINLTREEYYNLKSAGMLWVYYPEASGNYEEDMVIKQAKQIIKDAE